MKQESAQPAPANDATANSVSANAPAPDNGYANQQEQGPWGGNNNTNGQSYNETSHDNANNQPHPTVEHDDNYGPINVKEDG